MTRQVTTGPVLVLGATGAQGGAVAKTLLSRGVPVRVLVRDATSHGARLLAALSAELAVGTFTDRAAMIDACSGAAALFSMQNAPFADPDSERHEGKTIIEAARQAGVKQIVHTSVSGTGTFRRTTPGFGEEYGNSNYWESKAFVEDLVRSAGFATWTILRPAFMMENFTRPKADFMFPDLVDDALVTAIAPGANVALVSAEDVGKGVAAAIYDPSRFHTAEVELAGDSCTLPEIAVTLSKATGRTIHSLTLPAAEVISRGQFPGWVQTQRWLSAFGYPAKVATAHAFGLEPVNLQTWADHHATEIARR